MAWKVTFTKDSSDPKASNFTGACTANFLDDKGNSTFSYSGIIFSDDGVQDFVEKAKAGKAASDSDSALNLQIQQKLESVLNS